MWKRDCNKTYIYILLFPGYKTMFQTGDYGRIVNNQFYYEGRADSQVKVRGHRLDISEINTTINKLENVLTATVLCYKAGEPEQVGYQHCEKQ